MVRHALYLVGLGVVLAVALPGCGGRDPHNGVVAVEPSSSATGLFGVLQTTPAGDGPLIRDDHSSEAKVHVLLADEPRRATVALVVDRDELCLSTRHEAMVTEGCSPITELAGGRRILATIVVVGGNETRLSVAAPDAARNLTIQRGSGSPEPITLTNSAFTAVLDPTELPVTLGWTDVTGGRHMIPLSV